jgi:hypothetical protein
MKILTFGSPVFSSGFRNLGFEVIRICKEDAGHENDIKFDFYSDPPVCADFIRSIVQSFKPDVIFQCDQSRPDIFLGLETYEIPKIWYSIDSHIHGAWHKHYAAIFDKVYCAQKNQIDSISRYNPSVEWLPLSCSRGSEFTEWDKREYAVSFVGKLDNRLNPARVRLFSDLQRLGIKVFFASGDYVPVYSRSKVVINQSVADDLNLRFFEAPGCGALLITDRLTHSMSEILEPGVDYLIYEPGDARDLKEKVNWALKNDSLAEAMARRAHMKIQKCHLEIHRASKVAEWINKPQGKKNSQKEILEHLCFTYEHCSNLSVPAALSDFFTMRAYEIAMNVREIEQTTQYGLYVLGQIALKKEIYPLARNLFLHVSDNLIDPDAKLRILTSKLIAEIMCGFVNEGYNLLCKARMEFPDDPMLCRIEQSYSKVKPAKGIEECGAENE